MTGGPLVMEFLVEEPSAERTLDVLIPKIVPGVEFAVRVVPGKESLLARLPDRLRGYASRLVWEQLKVVVVLDRDDDDCVELKEKLEEMAAIALLDTPATKPAEFVLLNRIVIEELEAWFFGDVPAMRSVYPRLPATLSEQARFRNPDAIKGGTWEVLRDLLQKYGYYTSGFRKLEFASAVAPHMNIESNRSRSFQVFRDGVRRLVDEGAS